MIDTYAGGKKGLINGHGGPLLRYSDPYCRFAWGFFTEYTMEKPTNDQYLIHQTRPCHMFTLSCGYDLDFGLI